MVLLEVFIKTRTWLFVGPYKPPSQNENNFLGNLSFIINRLTCQYKNYVDSRFQHDYWKQKPKYFYEFVWPRMLDQKPTCFQSNNPKCIDLILINKKDYFKNSNVLEVEISDHHSLLITALKS